MEIAKDKWLRVSQVAARLNLSQSKTYQLIGAGHFTAIRVSDTGKGGIRVLESSLDDYIKRRIALFSLETGIPPKAE